MQYYLLFPGPAIVTIFSITVQLLCLFSLPLFAPRILAKVDLQTNRTKRLPGYFSFGKIYAELKATAKQSSAVNLKHKKRKNKKQQLKSVVFNLRSTLACHRALSWSSASSSSWRPAHLPASSFSGQRRRCSNRRSQIHPRLSVFATAKTRLFTTLRWSTHTYATKS